MLRTLGQRTYKTCRHLQNKITSIPNDVFARRCTLRIASATFFDKIKCRVSFPIKIHKQRKVGGFKALESSPELCTMSSTSSMFLNHRTYLPKVEFWWSISTRSI